MQYYRIVYSLYLHCNSNHTKQMYKEIETPAIAKKRYYFKKGYRQVTIAQKDEVRRILMSALNITRYTYFSHLLNNGIVDISMSKYEVITAILQKYGVTDIWDIVPENQKL